MKRHFVFVLWLLLAQAALAAEEPPQAEAASRMLAAMKAGDVDALKECYAPEARRLAELGVAARSRGETADSMKAIGRAVRGISVEQVVADGDRAAGTVILDYGQGAERATVQFALDQGRWKLAGDVRHPPLFLNAWLHAATAWRLAHPEVERGDPYEHLLAALEYERAAFAQKPEDADLAYLMDGLYGEQHGVKLDARLFAERLRRETLGKGGPGVRHHPTLADAQGFLLDELIRPGGELVHLAPYNTKEAGGFPYGVPPSALAYNYARHVMLMRRKARRDYLYLSNDVCSVRCSARLAGWADEERQAGRLAEVRAFGRQVDAAPTRASLEVTAADAEKLVDRGDAAQEARFAYRRAIALCHDGVNQCRDADVAHLRAAFLLCREDELGAMQLLLSADLAYLDLLGRDSPRAESVATVARGYQEAIDAYYRLILRHWVDEATVAAVYPERSPGVRHTHKTIGELDSQQYPQLLTAVKDHFRKVYQCEFEDIEELEASIRRATIRRGILQRMQPERQP